MEMKIKSLPALEDDQLKTPIHDQMCIELLDKKFLAKNIESDINIKKSLMQTLTEYDYTNKIFFPSYCNSNPMTHVTRVVEFQPIEITNTKLEHPIFVGQNKFLVGYVDLLCDIKLPLKITETIHTYNPKRDKYTVFGEWEEIKSYQGKQDYLTEHFELLDVKIETQKKESSISKQFAIEVKPKIKSVGEVLRQLQSYYSYLKCPIILYSIDKQYKEIFEGQGFSFWSNEVVSNE